MRALFLSQQLLNTANHGITSSCRLSVSGNISQVAGLAHCSCFRTSTTVVASGRWQGSWCLQCVIRSTTSWGQSSGTLQRSKRHLVEECRV